MNHSRTASRLKLTACSLALAHSLCAVAQDNTTTDEIINDIAADMEFDGTLTDDALDDLSDMHTIADNPIQLNTADIYDLSRIIFLSPTQISNIIRNRDAAGSFKSFQELLAVDGISPYDVDRLRHFVKLDSTAAPQHTAKTIKAEALTRLQRTFPLATGYKQKNDSTPPPFAGQPYRTLIRLRADVSDHISTALIAENDPGERPFSSSTRATDFTSGFIAYDNRHNCLRKLTIGHYRLRIAQGLGLWTGFSMDPTTTQASDDRNGMGLTPSTSAAEADFLRGIAAEIALGQHLRLTAFFSQVRADATTDTTKDGTTVMTTLRTSGLHRTNTERAYRHNIKIKAKGAYLRVSHQNTTFGLGCNTWEASIKPAQPTQLYRLFHPTKWPIITAHADYHHFFRRATLYGEAALQGHDAFALMQGLDADLNGGNHISVALRHYAQNYYTIQQQPHSRSTHAGGETGLYVGLSLAPLRRLSIIANADAYRLKWLQYHRNAPSQGIKARLAATVALGNVSSLNLRLSHHSHTATFSGSHANTSDARFDSLQIKSLTDEERQTSIRLTYAAEKDNIYALHTYVGTSIAHAPGAQSTKGWILGQDAKITTIHGLLTIAASAAIFNTDDYASRVYMRQPNVLYDMSFPSFYGQGHALTAMLRLQPAKWARLWLWASHASYSDKDNIGTGNDRTDGRHRTTAKIQLQLKTWKLIRRKH